MKTYIDNLILDKILHENEEISPKAINVLIEQEEGIAFEWPTLFKYLGEDLFKNFPKFDEKNPFFNLTILSVNQGMEKEILIRLYDELFIQCLTVVKAMPQIQQLYLLNKIREKRLSQSQAIFAETLDHYEKSLIDNPYKTLHGLILFLAWDRLCVQLAIAFEQVYEIPTALQSLQILKDCLVESFKHITTKEETRPSFFRLIEALYAFQLRSENLDAHSESAWMTLCKGADALKSREELSDVLYIDQALAGSGIKEEQVKVITSDSETRVKAAISLAEYMVTTLASEVSDWSYRLVPVEVAHL